MSYLDDPKQEKDAYNICVYECNTLGTGGGTAEHASERSLHM